MKSRFDTLLDICPFCTITICLLHVLLFVNLKLRCVLRFILIFMCSIGPTFCPFLSNSLLTSVLISVHLFLFTSITSEELKFPTNICCQSTERLINYRSKSTSGVNFTNNLHAAFSYENVLHSFYLLTVWL